MKPKLIHYGLSLLASTAAVVRAVSPAHAADKKPNILVIWGDDIGVHNISAYNHGIPDWTPTIGDLLKEQGYATGEFGKNHLGDRDNHLPTVHGFDEFFGCLYHLNAMEEPETYYYPKDPEFKKKFGPRGVIHSWSDGKGGQKIEDTGPLNVGRMPTIDEEIFAVTTKFIDKSVSDKKPFFVWFNTTRMHVWTHLKKESDGVTGIGLYPDGMVEHDKMVGEMLKKLDDLGIADNTIVVYGTDNGAETVSWPDGGITPFHGEKGTTWEGGMRVPMIVRWPGVIKPGTDHNEIFSQEDWMPTLRYDVAFCASWRSSQGVFVHDSRLTLPTGRRHEPFRHQLQNAGGRGRAQALAGN